MNIVWNQINADRFISSDGNFSIMKNAGRFSLFSTYNQKRKFYFFETLQAAFVGAQNIWRG